ncbi:MAG: hypothetical protein IT363_09995 [Methanoregulaceae archaeon]|nr:hypothetical protein [Methanoregulaceae archaeon]
MLGLGKFLYKLIMYMTHDKMVKSLASYTQRRELEELIRAFAIERADAAHQLARQKMECFLLARQREQMRRELQSKSQPVEES